MNIKTIFIFLIITISFASSGCVETGRSSVVDTVYDIGFNTFPWKTGFIYLTNDHPSAGKSGSYYSGLYTFDKDNTELYNFLNEAKHNQRKVELFYTNNMGYFPWEHDSDAVALVYKAEYVNTSK